MVTKPQQTSTWNPKRVLRVIRKVETSTSPLLVMTDTGEAYVKVLGNPEGPAALVTEWIGTQLAKWLGLPTFDIAVVDYPVGLLYPLTKGCVTVPGPAFATRKVAGRSWDGTNDDLDLLENTTDIDGLVVFDMWTRNYDRHLEPSRSNVRNVFFSEEGASKGHYRLLAMDHTECFRTGRSLTDRGLFGIDSVQDDRRYGLFPAFQNRLTREDVRIWISRLRTFRGNNFDEAAKEVPFAWGLRDENRENMRNFCIERAKFLADNAEKILEAPCNWSTSQSGT